MAMPIRWGDMDAIGHVNNAMYFRYFEQTRIHWFENLDRLDALDSDEGIVIVNANCTYLKPIHYPAEVNITMYGGVPGRSSFVVWYEILDGASGELYSTGSTKVVWVDRAEGKSRPLPVFIRSLLPTA